jgi:arginyl-tRNA synthetase
MTQTVTFSIADTIKKAIHEGLKNRFNLDYDADIKLDAPPDEKLGDFAFGCFPLAKRLRKAPALIAQELADAIPNRSIIKAVKPAGPYLNIFVNFADFFEIIAADIFENPETIGRQDIGQGQRVLVEYSAPNTNKPQHLGHVRNNLLGMSVTNLLETVGFDVIPVNLVNDRGVHICKSMLAYAKFGRSKTPSSEGIKGDHFVGDFYVRFEQALKTEKEQWLKKQTESAGEGEEDDRKARERENKFLQESNLYQQVQKMLQDWEAGDKKVRALWEKMNSWVLTGFQETYERLGCRFEKVYRESDTYANGREMVLKGLEKGVFYQKEDGSIWVDLSEEQLDHKLLLRRDGTSVYMTQDIGTTKIKFDDWKMSRAVWVVADEQNYHFQVLFAILKKLGFDWAAGCHHLNYGMIDLPQGKMKSREGTVVDADQLLDEIFEMEKAEIRERNIEIPEEDFEHTAEILAQGALKFFILKFVPKSRMTFDPKESISPLGFTGPYVQYAYVRVRSIFRKAQGIDFERFSYKGCDLSVLGNPEEKAIVRKLHDFGEELQVAAKTYNPARLCAYLFELAKALNTFYHDHKVLKAETRDIVLARLVLSKAAAIVLRRGLGILGIDVPERM